MTQPLMGGQTGPAFGLTLPDHLSLYSEDGQARYQLEIGVDHQFYSFHYCHHQTLDLTLGERGWLLITCLNIEG